MSGSPKIIIDGKAYDALEHLPEELKQALRDENQNGIPDIMEGKFSFGDIKNLMSYAMTHPMAIQVNYQGQTVNDLDQLPPEAKAKIEQAMAKLQTMQMPAASQGWGSSPANTVAPSLAPPKSSSSGPWVFLMILLGLLLTLVIAGWFVFSYFSR